MIEFLYVIRHCSVCNVRNFVRIGECLTADKADILTAVAAVEANAVDCVLTRELVGYGLAGYVIDQEINCGSYVVCNDAGNVGRATRKVNGLNIVGVGHQLELIGACIQLVALVAVIVEIVCIVASEIFNVNSNGDGLLFAGVDNTRFCKGNQIDVCLFNAAVLVFGGEINLYHILPGNGSRVGNRKRNGDFALAIDLGAFGNGKRLYRPLKGRIGKSKAKRILNDAFVAVYGNLLVVLVEDLSCIIIPNALNVGGLIPLVAKVNALDVIDKCRSRAACSTRVAAGARGVHIGGTRVVTDALCACALEVDIACHVVSIGVSKTAGGRDLTVENGGDRLCGACTRSTNHQAGINTGNGIYKIKLHRVGGVDDNDNVLIIFANVLEHCLFLGRDFKVVAVCIDCGVCVDLVLNSCRVLGLARVATDYNKRGIGKALGFIQKRGAVIVGIIDAGLSKSIECIEVCTNRADITKGCRKFAIHGDKACVIGNTVRIQSLQKVNVLGGVVVLGQNLTGAGAAIYPVDGCVAKYVDLGNLVKTERQNTVVLYQDASLFDNLFGKLLASFSCLVNRVAVDGKRMEVQNFLKECLKTRNVRCHLGLKHNNVADNQRCDQNCNNDNLYDLTDFHSYLRFACFISMNSICKHFTFFITNLT